MKVYFLWVTCPHKMQKGIHLADKHSLSLHGWLLSAIAFNFFICSSTSSLLAMLSKVKICRSWVMEFANSFIWPLLRKNFCLSLLNLRASPNRLHWISFFSWCEIHVFQSPLSMSTLNGWWFINSFKLCKSRRVACFAKISGSCAFVRLLRIADSELLK